MNLSIKRLLIMFLVSMIFSIKAEGKRVIVLGDGVTGTWATASIAENLKKEDEIIIISLPKSDDPKKLRMES